MSGWPTHKALLHRVNTAVLLMSGAGRKGSDVKEGDVGDCGETTFLS